MKKYVEIENMSCSHCERRVADALKKIKGVKVVSVSAQDKCAVIEIKKEIEDKIIFDAINELGFIAKNISEIN